MEAFQLNHDHVDDTCIICEEKKDSGIYICNQLICKTCQREIVETDVDDSGYAILVQKLKKLTVNLNEKVTESSSK